MVRAICPSGPSFETTEFTSCFVFLVFCFFYTCEKNKKLKQTNKFKQPKTKTQKTHKHDKKNTKQETKNKAQEKTKKTNTHRKKCCF